MARSPISSRTNWGNYHFKVAFDFLHNYNYLARYILEFQYWIFDINKMKNIEQL